MAQRGKVLGTQPENLSWIKLSSASALDMHLPIRRRASVCVHTHTKCIIQFK